MKHLLLLLLCASAPAFSQSYKERELSTSIEYVTVFLQGAQISRNGSTELPQGISTLTIKALSPYMDGESVQVKGTGDFTILSVNHKQNYLNRLKKNERIDSLQKRIEGLDSQLASHQSRLEVSKEKLSLLNENKKLGSETSAASLDQLKRALAFYDQELSAIKAEEIRIRSSMEALQKTKGQMEQEVASIARETDLPSGEVQIRIEAAQKTTASFTISYLVGNAGWYPKYDVRVKTVDQPLELQYKADIYQNTGINWENVQLRLSNANPNQSSVAPELQTWYLNYARNTIYSRAGYTLATASVRNVSGRILSDDGEGLPGATILVKGTTIGTVTDIDGNYSLTLPNGASHLVVNFIGYEMQELPITGPTVNTRMEVDLAQLDEVVVIGYGTGGRAAGVMNRSYTSKARESKPIVTSTVENQTTVEFEIEKPYSIKSNGDKLSVKLNSFEIETIYEYFAVPKLDKDAFLIARLVNWGQYHLLEGEANLYFEDAYVGRSILDARSLDDTLNISLGRDKSIVIGRTKKEDFSKRKIIGTNKIESREFEIIAKNKKSQPIRLTLFDQIPVAALSDITVTPTSLSGGTLKEKTGEVSWQMTLAPQQQTNLNLRYEVKYPKAEKVNLE